MVKYSFVILTVVLFLSMGVVLKAILGDPEQYAYDTCPVVPEAIEEINDNKSELTKLKESQVYLDELNSSLDSLNIDNSTIEKMGDLFPF